MEDSKIVDLYWRRSEQAITETEGKYGPFCYTIAYRVLHNQEDSEESVSDTYLAAWNEMPPKRPSVLAPYLGRITRNISIDRWRHNTADKRGGGEIILALEELDGCISGPDNVEQAVEASEIIHALNSFLGTLTKVQRDIFLQRYWLLNSIPQIADCFGYSESKVKSMLMRMRNKLRSALQKEGIL